ncbi:MAG: adenylyl-sulfate kinase [Desulfobacteraceae bacterium]|nr:adenylyl-sulfate kinase [Desulfobacteraceae bacterium]MBU4000902.1 adenylyl-sulfate kinase [Pseudomonadota bacterium]MBU4053800.1 adenylyl-sulfate kinase [Pseudomonadota bacterium]
MNDIAKERNLTWHNGLVARTDREENHGHRGAAVWFTGLSASGKSTIAHHLEKMLFKRGCSTYVFDGDNVRHGLCSDLSFSEDARSENIRRIGEMSKLFVDAGIIALTAFISPNQKDRDRIRSLLGEGNFFEIFVNCPIEICEQRDPKGIYVRARAGEIKNFTGISAPYEKPVSPHLEILSHQEEAMDSARRVLDLLKMNDVIPE